MRDSHAGQADPFVLVLVMFYADQARSSRNWPFAHIGIEVPTEQALDEIAARAKLADCPPPVRIPPPVGYV